MKPPKERSPVRPSAVLHFQGTSFPLISAKVGSECRGAEASREDDDDRGNGPAETSKADVWRLMKFYQEGGFTLKQLYETMRELDRDDDSQAAPEVVEFNASRCESA